MPESIGSFYTTQVPAYSESADIRQAFNLYHYGTTTVPTSEEDILNESMAGYIRDTLASLANVQAGVSAITQLLAAQNLDDITSTGVYASIASPTVSLKYPSTVAGILNVFNANSTVYQSYSTAGSTNNFYFRSTAAGTSTWSTWSLASKDGHTHDSRYYTQDQIDARVNTSLTNDSAAIVDANGKLSSSALISGTDLDRLEGLTDNIQTQLNDRALAAHNHNDLYYTKDEQPKIYVQSGTPTGATAGDLWFY
jgi:hypothetical protein